MCKPGKYFFYFQLLVNHDFLRLSSFVDYFVWPLDPDILKPKPLTVSACCKLIIRNKIFIRRTENVPEQRALFDKIFIVRNVMNFHQQRRSSSKPLRAAHCTAGGGFLQYLTNKTNSYKHKQNDKSTQTS